MSFKTFSIPANWGQNNTYMYNYQHLPTNTIHEIIEKHNLQRDRIMIYSNNKVKYLVNFSKDKTKFVKELTEIKRDKTMIWNKNNNNINEGK